MNDMNESADIVDQTFASSMKRRDFLTKAAAAGAVAWAAPVILSRPAYADDGVGGTPKCRPTVKVCCSRYFCDQGNKYFPGIAVAVGGCPCDTGTCASVCVRVNVVSHTAGAGVTIRAYGPATACGPLQQGGNDTGNIFDDGMFHCLTGSSSIIFFGKARQGNGAIGDIGSATVTFDMAVWAQCPDRSPGDGPAFTCETHRYTVGLVGMNNRPTCACDTPVGPSATLCPSSSPCPPPACRQTTCNTGTVTCPPTTGNNGDPSPMQSCEIHCPQPMTTC